MSYFDQEYPNVDQKPSVDALRDRYSQDDIPDSIDIIVSAASYEDYQGYGFVVYCLDGVCYEVNSSHCSCYGHEGQWRPEEVNLRELLNRPFYLGNEWGVDEEERVDNAEIRRLLEQAELEGRLR